MLKTKDVPRELRPFNSLFFSFQYKFELDMLFDDLLTILICCLARQTEEELYHKTIQKYTKKQLNIFAKMFGQLLIIYDNAKTVGDWADPLGDYYEALAGNYKKSRLGQFFTPKHLCDMIAQMTLTKGEWGKNINEPCAGSGRMILAANHFTEGNYYVAQDLDPICCKMTAINMCLHEVRGEVHNMDVLKNNNPTVSYSINYKFYSHKTLIILIKRPE